MKVRDLLEVEDVSMDVYDDYDERCNIAYESGYKLTDARLADKDDTQWYNNSWL